MPLIYKICPNSLWLEAERSGVFAGAPIDLADRFIHFSTGAQVRETAEKHFRGQTDLLLIAVDELRLGESLRYEISRGGASFPHLFAALSVGSVRWIQPLMMIADGGHIVSDDVR